MSTVIGVCDYGVGNLRSVERALLAAGVTVLVSDDAVAIAACDGVVLPGVGAFAVAARALRDQGLGEAVRTVARRGGPVLGVCLGHQLLFEHSDEGDGGEGLGLLAGVVRRVTPRPGDKVPHMGWNRLDVVRESALLAGIPSATYMYFVHSYTALASDADTVATTDFGGGIAAAVEHGNVMGTQFHPEKSGAAGLRIYANLAALAASRLSVAGPRG